MLSAKQTDAIRFATQEGSIYLSYGATRAGKTYGNNIGFAAYTQALDKPYDHLVMGKNLNTLEQNVVPALRQVCEAFGAKTTYARTQGRLVCGSQKYRVVAGNNEASKEVIQGPTYHSILADEAALVPESFWDMAVSRMTFEDSKLWGSLNPQGPKHWLKKKWIDEGKIDHCEHFTFDDNPQLTAKIKDRLMSSFSGVFFRRMVMGEWAAAEGVIYPSYQQRRQPEGRVVRTVIGVDYGTASPSAFVVMHLIRDKRTTHYHISEVVYVDDKPARTDSQLAGSLIELARRYETNAVVIDPSAASFIAEVLRIKGRSFAVRRARNEVLPGIRTTDNLLQKHLLTIDDTQCDDLTDEMDGYEWDPNKLDTPVKANDHACDAMRYAVMDIVRLSSLAPVKLPAGL